MAREMSEPFDPDLTAAEMVELQRLKSMEFEKTILALEGIYDGEDEGQRRLSRLARSWFCTSATDRELIKMALLTLAIELGAGEDEAHARSDEFDIGMVVQGMIDRPRPGRRANYPLRSVVLRLVALWKEKGGVVTVGRFPPRKKDSEEKLVPTDLTVWVAERLKQLSPAAKELTNRDWLYLANGTLRELQKKRLIEGARGRKKGG